MKRRILMSLLILVLAFAGLGTMAACKKNPADEGPEAGIFYYDGEGEEYLISLNSGDKFSFLVREANKSGTYKLKGDSLTLTFNIKDDGEILAVMSENRNEILLSYQNAEMRFMRKTNFTVEFDSNGGSEVRSLSVMNGRSPERPEDPTRADYTFVGWFLDPEFKTPFIFGTSVVTSDLKLYARWGEQVVGQTEFNVSYQLNYEGAPEMEADRTIGGHLLNRPRPERPGFEFRGWWVSMYDSAEKLSYAITDEVVLKEDVVAYARWESVSATRLASPEVWMTDAGISWSTVSGATNYNLEISGPVGFAKITESLPTNFRALEWPSLAMGDYVVKVTATSGNSANDSDPAVCNYRNRVLPKVSRFEVVLSSTLIFNPIEGADNYLITVDCGDKNHQHTNLDNGSSTYFNFSNCLMQPGGIKFTITARGDGYLDSVSKTFIYDRTLEQVKGVAIDEETQILHWNEVPNAADYVLEITCANGDHHPEPINNGNKTSFDLRECPAGQIVVSIQPKTKGYNSPEKTEYSFEKTRIATPGNLCLQGMILSWDPVENAAKYVITVDGVTVETQETEYDLTEVTSWASLVDYKLTIKAVDGANAESPESNPLDMRYMSLYETLNYYRGTFSWRHVLGATSYKATLNGEDLPLQSGKNFVNVEGMLTEGDNEFKLRFIEPGLYPDGSPEVTLIVPAYTIEFDPRSGNCNVDSICVAYGDKVNLPDATRDGYKLDGWYNAPGGSEANAGRYLDEYYQELGNIVLYASWSPDSYAITYVFDDGRVNDQTEVAMVYYQRDFVFTLPTSVVATNGFLGWFSGQGDGATRLTDQFGVGLEPWNKMEGGKVYAHWAHVFDYTLLSDPSKIGGKIASVRSGPEADLLEVLTVPTEYDGYPVKQVAGMGFMGQSGLKELNLPDSLILIGVDAFDGCEALERVNIYSTGTVIEEEIQYKSFDGVICRRVGETEWSLNYYPQARGGIYRIPDGVSQIGSGVFNHKPVTEIIIPADVTLVAENAFDECDDLVKVTFESALNSLKRELVIENNAFHNCGGLERISFPRQLFALGSSPNGFNGIATGCPSLRYLSVAEGNIHGYTSLNNMILRDSSIVYVIPDSITGVYVIPDAGVIGIGPYAFSNMKITELVVPKTLRTMEEGAFANNHLLKKITFVGDEFIGGLQLYLGKYAFRFCDTLDTVEFQPGCTVGTIGNYCFDNCTMLKQITLPSNLAEIQSYAFNNCTSLKTVNFEEGSVESDTLKLGRAIFNSCGSLTEVHLPMHVNEIEYGAFDGADALQGVYVTPGGIYSDDNGILYGNSQTELIYYPKTTSKGGDVSILPTVQRIGDSVFKNFTQMTSITIPASVNYIGAEAFFGCTGLTKVVFENSTEPLTFGVLTDEEKDLTGAFTFAGCIALRTMQLPSRILEIPAHFMHYDGQQAIRMTSFSLPNSVERIGEYAFYGARFATVSFPTSLKYIGPYAFMGTQLKEINLSGTQLEQIDDSAFESVRLTRIVLNLNNKLKKIGNRAFFNARANDVKLVEGLESIGDEAFAGSQLVLVDFPASLQKLGDRAFANCTSLTRYTLKSDVDYGVTVFTGCTSLFEIIVSEGVTLIPKNMLEGTIVQKITLPSTIKTIGDYAFANSTLKEVEFARSIQIDAIGVGAFQNCKELTTISLPEGIGSIGNYAFAGCTGLTTFTVCASVTRVGDYAFSGCTNLTSITFSGTDESGGLTLGSYVFNNCGVLETIHFPSNLRTLNGTIFSGCDMLKNVTFSGSSSNMFRDGLLISLDGKELILGLPGAANEEVVVPSSVEYVTNEAFARSRFKKVTFEEGGTGELVIGSAENEWTDPCNVFANNDFIEEVHFPENLVSIGASAFENCTKLRKVNIPTNVQYIGEAAFRGATHLEEFEFTTNSLEAIGTQAFYQAGTEGNGITGISLPDGLKEIESDIFSYSGFLSVQIPSTVNTINEEAFTNCQKLKEVTFRNPSRIRTIDERAFHYCTSLEKFELAQESGVLNLISNEAFYFCTSLKSFSLPESARLRTIGEAAFRNTGLESFTVADTIMAIEPFAFANCEALSTLTFEDGANQLQMGDLSRGDQLYRFEAGVFQFCTSLKEVKLPERLTNMGTGVFGRCAGLETVVLPASMKYLPHRTFMSCDHLKSVTFAPNAQIESLGEYIFDEGGPATFTVPKTVNKIESTTFQRATTLGELKFEEGIELQELGDYALVGCTNLKSVDFGSIVFTKIPTGLFESCESLEEFTIPETVTEIGEMAFERCSGLKKITFASNSRVTTIGKGAFQNTGELEITIPSSVNSIGDDAFRSSKATKIEFANGSNTGLQLGRFVFASEPKLTEIKLPSRATISADTTGLFNHSTGLQKVDFPNTINMIPDYTFTGCTSLKEITFGNQTSNSSLKFDSSSGLLTNLNSSIIYMFACGKEVSDNYSIPSSVTEIKRGAFQEAQHLKKLTIGNNVKTIEPEAFADSSVEEVIYSSPATETLSMFANCQKLTKATINSSATEIGSLMFSDCKSLETVTINDNLLTTIDSDAFNGSGLKTISKIPSSVKEVGFRVFYDTPNLTTVEFDRTNTSEPVVFGDSVFEYSNVQSVVLPYDISCSYHGYYMFKDCHKLTKVTLPQGENFDTLPIQMFYRSDKLTELEHLSESHIETIDGSALQECTSLTSVSLPETLVTIGEQAFLASGLTSITIPKSVTLVDQGAFRDCPALATVTFTDPDSASGEDGEEGVEALTFGDGVFRGCDGLKSLTLPEREIQLDGDNLFGSVGGVPYLETIVIPMTMTSIPSNLFANCIGLKTVTFKDGSQLNEINSEAFLNTKALSTITIPSSVTLIDTSAFEGSGLTTINIPAIQTNTALSKRAFANCKNLTTVKFDNGFKSDRIADELFAGCSALTEISLPECIKTLNKGAFKDCTSLTKVTGKNVLTIHPQVFAGCTALKTVELTSARTFGTANGWTAPEESAFYNCTSLESVKLTQNADDGTNENYIKLPAYAFYGCEKLQKVETAAKFRQAGNYAFYQCKSLENVDLSYLTSVGQYAFYDCEKITSATLSANTLAVISAYSFAECKSLANVTMSNSVTSIGEHAFENCEKLATVQLSSGVNTIDKYAFSGCSAITTLTIPASVNSIGDGAFKGVKNYTTAGNTFVIDDGVLYTQDMTQLIAYLSEETSFVVPESVEVIAESAFAGTNLTSVTIASSVQEIGNYAFDDCKSLNYVTFSAGSSLKKMGQYMFRGCGSLVSLTLPESITDFGSHVFSGSSIKSLVIPGNTNRISEYAFEGSGLESVVVPSSVTIIEPGAFMNCESLTSATIEADVSSVGDYMFAGCTSLEFNQIVLPTTLTAYSRHMFENCKKFTDITIPSNIISIGSYAFNGCEGLKSIKLHDALRDLGDVDTHGDSGTSQYLFAGTALTELEVPSSVSAWCFQVSEHMFDGLKSDSFNLKVKSNITQLGSYMFANIPSEKFTLTLPDHIQSMGDYMFSGTNITSFELSSKLISLGRHAFEKTKLQTFTVQSQGTTGEGENINVLNAEGLFAGLNSTTLKLNLPDYIKAENLGEKMFTELDATTFTLELPNGIDYLPYSAFENSVKLQTVTINGNITQTTLWNEPEREGDIPGGYQGELFAGCTSLQTVTFPTTLTKLGPRTFLGCTSLATYTIPNGVTHIGSECFQDCTALSTLTIPEKIEFVGASAFRNWTGSQKLVINGDYSKWHEWWKNGAEGVEATFNNKNS